MLGLAQPLRLHGSTKQFNLPQVTFYPTAGNLREYYASIHRYMLAINDMAAQVKGTECFSESNLQEWRNLRNRWSAFYDQGPSVWFTLLSEDADRAVNMHQRALQWEVYLVTQCPDTLEPLPPTRRPLGTPSTFASVAGELWSAAKETGQSLYRAAGEGFGSSVGQVNSTLAWIGFGFLALGGLYVGYRIWRR